MWTAEGHRYTGRCIDLACGVGGGAAGAAVAERLQASDTPVVAVVVVSTGGVLGHLAGGAARR